MIFTADDYERLRAAANVFVCRLLERFTPALRDVVGLPQGDHCISSRVKASKAIARKLAASRDGIVNDYLGVRVLCAHWGMIQHTRAAVSLAAGAAGLVAVRSQQLGDVGHGEYRALHLDFLTADAELSGLPDGIGVEVQIMTWLQYLVAGIAHDLTYKPSHGDVTDEDREFLRRAAAALARIDRDFELFLSRRLELPPTSG